MLKKFNKSAIVKQLTAEGFHFREFSLEHVGRYAAADADWNYKDIPHLHHVHHLAEAVPTAVGDDMVATINTQKVLGIKVPLSVFNYETAPGEQTYYTTLFWFVLLIQTRFVEEAPLQTRVTTTYSIGMPTWLRWAFGLLRWTITRNYHVLMSTDIPMRNRRGELRARGFNFMCAHNTYSFGDTQLIMRTNVVPPDASDTSRAVCTADIREVLPRDGEALIGSNDHLGFRLHRQGDKVEVYPRICPHEGSCLDETPVQNGKVRCPWHGREFGALGTVALDTPGAHGEFRGPFSRAVIEGSTIRIYALDRGSMPVKFHNERPVHATASS